MASEYFGLTMASDCDMIYLVNLHFINFLILSSIVHGHFLLSA